MIRKLLPKTSYERESFLKAFLLFFLTMEFFILLVSYILYNAQLGDLRNRVFLELKNYSYTYEGEGFQIDIVPARKEDRLYELLEGEEGLYILVPVPVSKEDRLKVIYPKERLFSERRLILLRTFLFTALSSMVSLLLSFFFSIYALNPLRRALKVIEEVTRDIIHDLNTPLMTLRVNLKILRSRYDDEEIERAELALRQLIALKENLRPLESEIRLRLEEVDLKDIVERELEGLKKIYTETKVKEELSRVILRTDRGAVMRIVGNLLDNAFKHGQGDSWVRVTLTEDRLVVENPSRPPENIARLFDRYYRESQRGLGLGLAIVRKLCEELGWKVKLSYEGGVFRVEVIFR